MSDLMRIGVALTAFCLAITAAVGFVAYLVSGDDETPTDDLDAELAALIEQERGR